MKQSIIPFGPRIAGAKNHEFQIFKEHLVPDNKAKYRAAAVTAIDAGVGKIVEALKEQGLYENSILVFSTDNGGSRSPVFSIPRLHLIRTGLVFQIGH